MGDIVIGYWSQDVMLHPELCTTGNHSNVFVYEDAGNLKKQIIEVFSFDSQTVIDADPINGTSFIKSHKYVHFAVHHPFKHLLPCIIQIALTSHICDFLIAGPTEAAQPGRKTYIVYPKAEVFINIE